MTIRQVAAGLRIQAESYRRMATMIDGDCDPEAMSEDPAIWPMALVLRSEAKHLEHQAELVERMLSE